MSLVQGSCGQLHQDIGGDPTAVPSSDEMHRSTFLFHPAGNLELVRFPHEPDGGSLQNLSGPVTATHRFDVSTLLLCVPSGSYDGSSSSDHCSPS